MSADYSVTRDAAAERSSGGDSSPLLAVDGLRKNYVLRRSVGDRIHRSPGTQVAAVDDVSFDLHPGETLGIAGESGSGKTTVVRCLIRLIEPDAGSIMFDGIDVRAASGNGLRDVRRRIQMVFQDPHASLNPRLKVGAAILEAGRVHSRPGSSDGTRFVSDLLDLVNLSSSVARKPPRELSGGQRQRVAIARALAVGPEVLIADEAVSALDVSVQAQLLNLFIDLKAELGLTMIFVAHQLSVIAQTANRVAIMYLGRIIELGPAAAVFRDPQHPYTLALLAAHPQPDPSHRMNIEFRQGSAVTGVTSGCQYRQRCPYAEAVCEEEDPLLAPAGPGRLVACIPRPLGSTDVGRRSNELERPPRGQGVGV
jgi:oligopeptide/dipeptide ABC transporter ATP-binding protein